MKPRIWKNNGIWFCNEISVLFQSLGEWFYSTSSKKSGTGKTPIEAYSEWMRIK